MVLVSPSHRLLFIHVQRTGGLTVRNALLAALPDAYEVTGPTDGTPTCRLR